MITCHEKGFNTALMAERAGGRANVYDLFVWVFSRLPDRDFLEKIRGEDINDVLDALSGIRSERFRSGLDLVQSYITGIEGRPDEEVMEELSVDRTRLLRCAGEPSLKPPCEGLYRDAGNSGTIILELQRFYRSAGILPDDSIPEPPDHICIELDFMRQLCLRESNLWASDRDVSEAVTLQDAFLREHLGSWIGEFSEQVQIHSLTKFYRGFSEIIEAFILLDLAYLENLDLFGK